MVTFLTFTLKDIFLQEGLPSGLYWRSYDKWNSLCKLNSERQISPNFCASNQ